MESRCKVGVAFCVYKSLVVCHRPDIFFKRSFCFFCFFFLIRDGVPFLWAIIISKGSGRAEETPCGPSVVVQF